ncbi:MAG: hypothetical protein K2W96_07755 [Gemmataceae bacterium]|nr:hypothetical protein [Gemmataceae bacterium]
MSRQYVRPRLETLEDRCVPANLYWAGAADGNWSVAGNWKYDNGMVAVAAPTAMDVVYLDNTSNTNSKQDIVNLTVAGLHTTSAFTSTVTLANTLKVAGDGWIEAGTFSGAGSLRFINGSSTQVLFGGTFNAAVWFGDTGVRPTVTFDNASDVVFAGGVENWGSMQRAQSGTVKFDSTFNNRWSYEDIYGSGTAGTGTINNTGTFKASVGSGTSTVSVNFTNASGGQVQALSGLLKFTGTFLQDGAGTSTTMNGGNIQATSTFRLNGGTFSGTGTFTGDLNNQKGSVIPGLGGSAGGVAGTLTISGTYLQSGDGTLVINIDNANVSKLVVTSTINLDGELKVNRNNGFTPAQGNDFIFLTYNGTGSTGWFDIFTLPNNSWANGGTRWFLPDYDDTLGEAWLHVM